MLPLHGGARRGAGGTPLVLSTLQLSVSSGLQLLRTPRLRGDPQPCACCPAASLSLFSLQSAEPRAHPLTLLLTLHRALEKQSGVSPWDLFTLISILAIRFFTYFFSPPSLPSEPTDLTGRRGRKSNTSAQVPPSLKFPMILFSRVLASESSSFGRQLPSPLKFCITFSLFRCFSPSVWTYLQVDAAVRLPLALG